MSRTRAKRNAQGQLENFAALRLVMDKEVDEVKSISRITSFQLNNHNLSNKTNVTRGIKFMIK